MTPDLDTPLPPAAPTTQVLTRTPASPAAVADALRDGIGPGGTRGGRDERTWGVRRVWPADMDDPAAGYVLEMTSVLGRRGATWDERGLRLMEGDRKLPGLAPRIVAGYEVIGHRPAKRAVVRSPQGTFVKLAKPRATHRALEAMAEIAYLLDGVPDAPGLPRLVEGSTVTGMLELAPAPGRALGDVLADADPHEAARRAGDLARALVALAGIGPVPRRGGRHAAEAVAQDASAGSAAAAGGLDAELPTHTLADEAGVLERWARSALGQAPLHPDDRRALAAEVPDVAARLRALGDADHPWILTHRDLHEGQILLGADPAPRLTVLDWDTAAFAHPAADLANLLAHLDRLARREELRRDVVVAFRARLLDRLAAAGHPAATGEGREALTLLEEATALRLIAVHGFRTPDDVRA